METCGAGDEERAAQGAGAPGCMGCGEGGILAPACISGNPRARLYKRRAYLGTSRAGACLAFGALAAQLKRRLSRRRRVPIRGRRSSGACGDTASHLSICHTRPRSRKSTFESRYRTKRQRQGTTVCIRPQST
eukprot:scaffold7673_cov258-Pinguiococcus_pyrenoidosus.AAC.4